MDSTRRGPPYLDQVSFAIHGGQFFDEHPRLPVNEGQVTATGAIVIGAAILAALIGAVLGGLAGMRFHRNVDKAGLEPTVT